MKNVVILCVLFFLVKGCNIDGVEVADIPEIEIETTSIAAIDVISPTSADRWKKGESYLIRWSSPSGIKTVRIELYRKTALQRVIINDIENRNEYWWNIPDEIATSLNYSIKVVNTANENQFGFSQRFTIER